MSISSSQPTRNNGIGTASRNSLARDSIAEASIAFSSRASMFGMGSLIRAATHFKAALTEGMTVGPH
jgi:hypothetical protein